MSEDQGEPAGPDADRGAPGAPWGDHYGVVDTAADAPAPTALASAAPGLLRSSAVVALGTALSRLTGFVRLAATAYAIGFTRLTDTYTLANTTPNMVYELLLGGVLSATLVPIFVEQADSDDDDGTSAVITVATAMLVAVTVVGILAAPLIVRIYTVGVEGDVAADQQQVATALLRLFMPQMLFYGLTALATAALNARRRFAAPAFAPVINNLLVTGALLALPAMAGGTPSLADVRDDTSLLLMLGLGTTAGIVAMTLALGPAVRRAGIRLRANFDWRHPAVRHVGRMSGWTVGYVLTNQIVVLAVLILANREAGGVSAYTGAFVFFQLPHALFAVSLMTALVPELASAAQRADRRAFQERFSLGLRLTALVVLPAATGYMLLARPIVAALLERGALSGASADLTADTLAAFGAGLFGFSFYLFALRAFYAHRDTRTPFLLNMGENALNILLALALFPLLGVPGLALAYGLAYTIAGAGALAALRHRVGHLDGRRVIRSVARIVAACVVMAAAVSLTSSLVGSNHGTGAMLRTAAGVSVGITAFGLAALAFGIEEVSALRERLVRRAPTRSRGHA